MCHGDLSRRENGVMGQGASERASVRVCVRACVCNRDPDRASSGQGEAEKQHIVNFYLVEK